MPGCVVMLLLLAACAPGDEPALVELLDENNYSFVGDLHVPVYETRAGQNVTVGWSAMAHDLQCHDIDPAADIDNIALIRFPKLDNASVELGMEMDSLLESDLDGYAEVYTDDTTTANLEDMTFYGSTFDLAVEYTEGGGTYVLILTTGRETGRGARMVNFLQPKQASEVATVEVRDGCGVLDLTVDIGSLLPVDIPIQGGWTFDWSGITLDGQGGYIAPTSIDELTIANVEDWDAEDLEANFLDLELHATREWSWALTGGTDLTLEPDGDVPDFSAPGLWVLGLRCTSCYNPAPIFLTLLHPVDAEKE